MKKFISAALVCMMLLSAFAPIANAAERYTGDPGNGKGLVQEVQAYALPTAPVFDYDDKNVNPTNETLKATGAIDRAIWGEPTVVAKATEANTAYTAEPNDNVLFVFDHAFDDSYKEDPETAAYAEGGSWDKLSYRLWLAWDNDNYYVAAEIDDPDGYSLPNGNSSIWDGDCLQFMVDPLGPNGVMKYADFNYDYKTQCFDWWTYKAPWYNQNNVLNLGVGHINVKKNPYQVVNMAPNEQGTIISETKTKRGVKFNMISAEENLVNPGMTVLQIAIPWTEILKTAQYAGNITADNIGAGYVLGMSASVLNGSNINIKAPDLLAFLNADEKAAYDTAVETYNTAKAAYDADPVGDAPIAPVVSDFAGTDTVAAYDAMVSYVNSAKALAAVDHDPDGGWTSYLNWGSGVTGASMETKATWFPYVNPGSNAVVLNNKSAVDHETEVTNAKVAAPIEPVKHVDQLIFMDIGDSDNQLPTQDTQYYNVESGIAAAVDIAITGVDPTDISRSLIGWWIGDGYSVYAGYDISTQTFVVAQQDAANGLNRDIIYMSSPLTYNLANLVEDPETGDFAFDDSVPADWHRLGIKIVGNTVELFLDGKSVLTCTNDRIGHHIIGEEESAETGVPQGVGDWLINQSFVMNNTAACVFDNYVAGSADYNLKGIDEARATSFLFKYTFDSDDPEWNASPMRSAESRIARVNYDPLNAESDAYYKEKAGAAAVKMGDVDGDGNINARDVILVMKASLPGFVAPEGYVAAAADMDGDTNINARDVIEVMKAALKEATGK